MATISKEAINELAIRRYEGEVRLVASAEDVARAAADFAAERAVCDLGALARRAGVERSGVRALAALFLGFRIPKGTKTSNWAAPRLSPQQIAYAATDAWACRELYLKFETLGMLQ